MVSLEFCYLLLWRQRNKRLLFKLNSQFSHAMLYEALWPSNNEIFLCNNFRKLPRSKATSYMLSGVSKCCTKFSKSCTNTNICGKQSQTEKCHILPAVQFICSVHFTATYRRVSEQTKADIVWTVKWWMLVLRHNKSD